MPSAAAMLDRTRRAANERKRRYRQRLRDGTRLVTFEVDEIGIIGLLSHHGLLPSCGSDSDSAIDRALKQLVDRLIAADAEQRHGSSGTRSANTVGSGIR
jgi:hypothetical protein